MRTSIRVCTRMYAWVLVHTSMRACLPLVTPHAAAARSVAADVITLFSRLFFIDCARAELVRRLLARRRGVHRENVMTASRTDGVV